ncbi:sulfite exporter TauE/SafE family protein [Marinomonas sp. A79]|uniref:Probable membrane transporter protein n=1 Tax=Marinomonas vulgaris TaxID=2823372 RepID=A0ABS5HGE3_9GAMM|nr:sulfite exporter TauE/SafE family protein [Marinomonas vulgaris]MBR7889989.1 sulfite exporter TauE/SafE family protein [Marinomonas vulgaris]
MPFDLDLILMLIPIAMLAGIVRGYAGFGFAAIAVVGLNFFLPPSQSVPVVLGLDVLCSFSLWRQAMKQADFQTLKLLIIGAIIGIPIGLSLILFIPEEILKFAICVVILILALVLMFDFRLRRAEAKSTKLGFGLASGIGTAGASVGGPMIVCYMLSSPLDTRTQRATMILFFIASEALAMMALFAGGLVDLDIIKMLFLLLFPTLVAVRIGQWFFNRNPPKSLKHFSLPILLLVSILGISASVNSLF